MICCFASTHYQATETIRTILLGILVLCNQSLQIDESRRPVVSSSSLHITLRCKHE